MLLVVKVIFWTSLALLVWTHVAYPLFIALLARLRPRAVRDGDALPGVSLIIAAHNEEQVIEARLDNALALDYPRDLLEVVVASDGSTDATDRLVRGYADRGVRLIRCPRNGKTAAQDRAVRETSAEVVAFSDANSIWEPDALRQLVRPFSDPEVAMVTGRLRLAKRAQDTNQEGLYWRYEMWLRAHESQVHSITGSNGGIYALRRSAYRELDPRVGHDLSFPYRIVQDGHRAVYQPSALATERMAADIPDEFRRKVRMLSQSWRVVGLGGMLSLRRVGPLYWLELFSHRLLRYSIGLLHLLLLATSAGLAAQGDAYLALLIVQLAAIGLALLSLLMGGRVPGLSVLQYYMLLTLATLIGLWRALQGESPATWDKAVGTR